MSSLGIIAWREATWTGSVAAPHSLAAFSFTGASITLTWMDVPPYQTRVYRDNVLIATLAAGVRTYTDTGRTNGTSYAYKVAAWDGGTEYTQSAVVNASSTASIVTTFTAVGNANEGFSINWTAPAAGTFTQYWFYAVIDGVEVIETGDPFAMAPGSGGYSTTQWQAGMEPGVATEFRLYVDAVSVGVKDVRYSSVTATTAVKTPSLQVWPGPDETQGLIGVKLGTTTTPRTWDAVIDLFMDGGLVSTIPVPRTNQQTFIYTPLASYTGSHTWRCSARSIKAGATSSPLAAVQTLDAGTFVVHNDLNASSLVTTNATLQNRSQSGALLGITDAEAAVLAAYIYGNATGNPPNPTTGYQEFISVNGTGGAAVATTLAFQLQDIPGNRIKSSTPGTLWYGIDAIGTGTVTYTVKVKHNGTLIATPFNSTTVFNGSPTQPAHSAYTFTQPEWDLITDPNLLTVEYVYLRSTGSPTGTALGPTLRLNETVAALNDFAATATGAGGQVNTTWTLNPGLQTRIYRDSVLVTTVAAGTAFYLDTGLTDGQVYAYQAATWDGSTQGTLTSVRNATPISQTDLVPNGDDTFPSTQSASSGTVTATPRWSKIDDAWGSVDTSDWVDMNATAVSQYQRFITTLTDIAAGQRVTGLIVGGYFTGLGFDSSNNVYARPFLTARDPLAVTDDFSYKADFVGRAGAAAWGSTFGDGDISWYYDNLGTGASPASSGIDTGKGYIDPNTTVLNGGLATQTPSGTTSYYVGNAQFIGVNNWWPNLDGSIEATYESGDSIELILRYGDSGNFTWCSVGPRSTLNMRTGGFDNMINTGPAKTLTPGDRIKLSVSSNSFNVYYNDTLIINGGNSGGQQWNDSSHIMQMGIMNAGSNRHSVSKVVMTKVESSFQGGWTPSTPLTPSDMGAWKTWTLTNAEVLNLMQGRRTGASQITLSPQLGAEILNAGATVIPSMRVHNLGLRVLTGPELAAPVISATPSAGQVLVTWPAVTSAATYYVRRNGNLWTETSSLSTTFTETDGILNNYQVAAVSLQGHRGPLSNALSVAAGAGGTPSGFAAFGIPL